MEEILDAWLEDQREKTVEIVNKDQIRVVNKKGQIESRDITKKYTFNYFKNRLIKTKDDRIIAIPFGW